MIKILKGAVNVILVEPPSKVGNGRFTTVPLKPWSDQKCGRHRRFLTKKCLFLWVFLLLHTSKNCASHFRRETANEKKNIFYKQKTLISNFWIFGSNKAFKFTVNRALPSLHRFTWNFVYIPFKTFVKVVEKSVLEMKDEPANFVRKAKKNGIR